jgi:hypothetical protein
MRLGNNNKYSRHKNWKRQLRSEERCRTLNLRDRQAQQQTSGSA